MHTTEQFYSWVFRRMWKQIQSEILKQEKLILSIVLYSEYKIKYTFQHMYINIKRYIKCITLMSCAKYLSFAQIFLFPSEKTITINISGFFT